MRRGTLEERMACRPATRGDARVTRFTRQRRKATGLEDERLEDFASNQSQPILCAHLITALPRVPRLSQHPKEESFNFRVDPRLKAAFQAATEAEDKRAAQVLRDFMRSFVERHHRRAFGAEARRQSRLIAERAADPSSDEAEVMRWIEDVSRTDGRTA